MSGRPFGLADIDLGLADIDRFTRIVAVPYDRFRALDFDPEDGQTLVVVSAPGAGADTDKTGKDAREVTLIGEATCQRYLRK